MRCKRENILLPFNHRKHVDLELLMELQNKYLREDLLKLKGIAKGDTKTWNILLFFRKDLFSSF